METAPDREEASTASRDFVRELSEEMARLVAKYHDETASTADVPLPVESRR